MLIKVTILGCGISGGIPMLGNIWGDCDPMNPKNNRLRSSVLVEIDNKKILIDTSPDLRTQFLDANIDWIDAVLYTHAHADHTHGINDLAPIGRRKKPIPVYGDAITLEKLHKSFEYAFYMPPPAPTIYKPFLIPYVISPPSFMVDNLKVICFEQDHGFSTSLGFRIGDFAYSTDVTQLSEQAFEALQGVKVWIVDCLRYEPHETHSHLEKSLEWIRRINPERAYLTHLGIELDYDTLLGQLPPNVLPCYDGLKIEV